MPTSRSIATRIVALACAAAGPATAGCEGRVADDDGTAGDEADGGEADGGEPGPDGAPPVVCTRVAAPDGSDRGDGTPAAPFRTLQRLSDSLAAGETGCLRAGSYGDVATQHTLRNGGTAAARVTIASYPGERAKLLGFVVMDAPYLTLAGFEIDGANDDDSPLYPGCAQGGQALQINGTGDVFERNDFYQSSRENTAIGVGFPDDPAPDGVVIRFNKIHDYSGCKHFDHGVYVAHATNTEIHGNWFWNGPHGYGVQLYPEANGSHIYANVFDLVGSGFTLGGESGTTSSDNLIEHNVVARSVGLPDSGGSATDGVFIGVYWPGEVGTGNVVRDNVSFDNGGGFSNGTAGYSLSGAVTADPRFVDAAAHDYRLMPGSPAAEYGLWDGD